MKFAELPYEEALSRHPEGVAEILRKLRAGKSKSRNAAPETFTWSYQGCVEVTGSGSLATVLANHMKPAPVMSLDEKVADQLSRTRVSLCGTVGRWAGHADVSTMPAEVEAYARKGFEKEAAEEARLAALTPAQRKAEVEDLLKQLRKSPGFFEL